MNRLTTIMDQAQMQIPTKPQQEEALSDTDVTVSCTGDDSSCESGEDSSERLTRVAFTSVQIRSFNRIVGDHPDVRNGGPPLSIGWEYVEGQPKDLDDYEQEKEQRKADSETPWMFGLRRLTSGKRRDLLRMTFEIPLEEIEAAEAQVERVKKQRSQTNSQKKVFARTEEMMQSAKRKLQRTIRTPAVRDETRLLGVVAMQKKEQPKTQTRRATITQPRRATIAPVVRTPSVSTPPPMPMRRHVALEVSV